MPWWVSIKPPVMRRSYRSRCTRQPSLSSPMTPPPLPQSGLGLDKMPNLSVKLTERMSSRNQTNKDAAGVCCLSPKRAGDTSPAPPPHPPPPCCSLQVQSLNSLWIYQTNILEVGSFRYQSTRLIPQVSDLDCVTGKTVWTVVLTWRVSFPGLARLSKYSFVLGQNIWCQKYRS